MSLLKNIKKKLSTPSTFFFVGPLRDDAFGDYTVWDKNDVLEDLDKGQTAMLFGYTLHRGQWGNRAFICESKYEKDVVVGRVMKFNESGGNFQNKLKSIKRKRENGDNVMKIVNVYLENDEQKQNAIFAICFVNTKEIKTNLIASGDWLKQNVLASEIPYHSNNRIYSGKGLLLLFVFQYFLDSNLLFNIIEGSSALHLSSARVLFKEWKEDTVYEKDDIICLDAIYKRWNSKIIDEFKFWAMCMNKHTSNALNKPQREQIFTDLTLNHGAFVRLYLIEHVQGFNEELGAIIISYCYKTNDFWWNGCSRSKYNDYCNCGDLIMGMQSTEYCKLCMIEKNGQNKSNEAPVLAANKKSGAVICLNKDDGKMVRTYLKNDEDDMEVNDDFILRTKIENDAEKQKIFNLFCRNFHKAMAPLIKACVYGHTSFVYEHNGNEVEVEIGDANVWCMYDSNEQLLCSLIWRFVHVDGPRETLLFETLFLSTFENVRFRHYGQKMVKQIELYCIQHQYDLMAVAAVPVHGEAFWESNGFELVHNAPTDNTNKDKRRQDHKDKRRQDYELLKHHMLVFDDTPLFAKRVRRKKKIEKSDLLKGIAPLI